MRPSISAAKAASGVSVGASGRERVRDPGGRDPAADDALAVIGLKPIDARRLVRQALPDRQQQAGDDMDRAFGELRHFGKLGAARRRRSVSRSASTQWLSAIIFSGRLWLLHRPDQPHAPLDLAVVEHQARRRDLHGGAARALVDQQHGATIGETIRAPRRASPDGCARAAVMVSSRVSAPVAGMGVDRAPVGDDEALGAERLQPDVVDAASDRAFDPGGRATARRR